MEDSCEKKPSNDLAWSILSTLFCCLPFGIVAIVYSSKVDSLWFGGNHNEAIEAAKKARMWNIVSLCIGIAGGLIYFFCSVIFGILGA